MKPYLATALLLSIVIAICEARRREPPTFGPQDDTSVTGRVRLVRVDESDANDLDVSLTRAPPDHTEGEPRSRGRRGTDHEEGPMTGDHRNRKDFTGGPGDQTEGPPHPHHHENHGTVAPEYSTDGTSSRQGSDYTGKSEALL